MIECPQCGQENALGRLFCDSCGQRLDLSGVKPTLDDGPHPGRGRRKKKGKKGKRTRLAWLLYVFLLAVLVGAPLLAAWPPALPPMRTSMGQSDRFRATVERLLAVGQGARVGFLQDDVNSYAVYRRGRNPELPRIVVSFREDGVRAYLWKDVLGVQLVAVLRWIPTDGSRGRPVFQPASVRIGHLPLPPPLFGWTANQFPEVREEFDTEFRILSHCVSAKVPAEGRLGVQVKFRL